ncbi:MAG: NADPH-dependent glutamate synthase [Elusimicrobiota bacterium]
MAKEKKRIPVKKRPAEERRKDFGEVSPGLSREEALREAQRCMMCPKRPCVNGCPVGIAIPDFIKALKEDNIKEAYSVIKRSNTLPGVCGRVCPQEDQCAANCVYSRTKKFDPVNIGLLERRVADGAYEAGALPPATSVDKSKPSVAVVGSGPAGLTLASDMAGRGYPAVIYESLHAPGGVLRYGIPEFRLPNHVIDREVKALKEMGVEIKYGHVIGNTYTVKQLREMHDAVFIAIGAGLPRFMGIPGENLNGVYSANEYLTRSNLMEAYKFPSSATPILKAKRVAVVGGGNVAMDATRTALRLGAQKVYNIYRRSREEMPARDEEIENALQEGVNLKLLANPVEVIPSSSGDEVSALKCIKMRLGEPDSSGRRRPVEIPGSEFQIDAGVVVMAIGTAPNRVLLESAPELKLNQWGYIETDENTGRTSIPGVYAGGDIVTGSATVISAMGAARKAGENIRKSFEQK